MWHLLILLTIHWKEQTCKFGVHAYKLVCILFVYKNKRMNKNRNIILCQCYNDKLHESFPSEIKSLNYMYDLFNMIDLPVRFSQTSNWRTIYYLEVNLSSISLWFLFGQCQSSLCFCASPLIIFYDNNSKR